MVVVGRDIRRLSGPTPCSGRATFSRLPRTISRQLLKISRNGDSTTSLGNLFQQRHRCVTNTVPTLADLFSLVTSDRTCENAVKLGQWRVRLDIRKRYFTERVVVRSNKLPTEVVTAPSLSVFKKCLDCALSHVV